MKFLALLPVRDESDIVAECLRSALRWADEVWVYDTGSVDTTWQIVCDIASEEPRIHTLGSAAVYFSEQRVRGYLFEQARTSMRTGDWFVRVDADEFHHIDPPEFVASALHPGETVVYHQYYNFCLTAKEAQAWKAGAETLADRSRPIAERRRFYTLSEYSEPRMCRYRDTMRWPEFVSFPFNAGLVARERLPIRHYPHRDPDQLARRCRLRAVMMADASNRSHWKGVQYHHWSEADWRAFITEDTSSDLHYWAPAEPLPQVRRYSHLARHPKRAAQWLLYATGGASLLDRLRPHWTKGAKPQPIDEEKVRELKLALSGTHIE